MEKHGAKNPGAACLPEEGNPPQQQKEGVYTPTLMSILSSSSPLAACQLWGRRLEAKSRLSQGSLAPRHPGPFS